MPASFSGHIQTAYEMAPIHNVVFQDLDHCIIYLRLYVLFGYTENDSVRQPIDYTYNGFSN
jgi:hypothetical protein